MMDKIGDEFQGIISTVTSFGLFVQLDHIYVDGLVHITALKNDFYHFDSIGHRLTGERNGQVFRLGDPIRIKVAAVNLDDRKIDFVLADNWVSPKREKPAARYHRAKGKHDSEDKKSDKRKRHGKKDKSKSKSKSKQHGGKSAKGQGKSRGRKKR